MTRGRIAAALAILTVVGYAAFTVIGLASLGPDLADPVAAIMFGAAVAAFSVMGSLLVWRVPANPIGPLLLATGAAQSIGLGLQLYGSLGSSGPEPLPGAAIALALTDVWYLAPFMIALIGVPLVFPDGRLPSPRFRWVVRATAGGMVALTLAGLTPLTAVAGSDAILGALLALAVGSIIFGFGGAVAAIWVRFQHGSPVQRQQVKWLLADAGIAGIAFPAAIVLGDTGWLLDTAFWVIGFLAFVALPVAIGLAVLRYRLYEIDRLISRTIGWAIVTGALAVVFGGMVLLLQAVLEPLTGGSTMAVAASTLMVAALFRPLGQRVQTVVDRRFNRARYHAEGTATAFAVQMRDAVDLASLRGDLLDVVARTVAPEAAGLWIRRSEVER